MYKVVFSLFLTLSVLSELSAQLVLEDYLTSGLSSVTDIANAGDNSNRLFFAERDGDVWVNPVGTTTLTRFLDINPTFGSGGDERGLLGLVFHPNYASNGYFFVNYTTTQGGQLVTRVSRFQVSSGNVNQANASSEVIILQFDQPFGNHNGGGLAMDNQYLYIASGDGGSGGDPDELAQDLTSPLGKILRITPSTSSSATNFNAHTVPTNNPYATSGGDTVPEIWHVGVRNPWRIHIDEQDRLWIADVGQSAREEINLVSNGSPINFGWDCREGKIEFEQSSCVEGADYRDPIWDYANPSVGRSVTGGVVLPASRYPNFNGHYIFGDYGSDRIWTLTTNGTSASVTELNETITRVSTFGLDESGNAYGASLTGTIYRFSDAALPVALINTGIERIDERVRLHWTTSFELNASHFEIERRTAGAAFEKVGNVTAKGNNQDGGTDYQFLDQVENAGHYFYRLKAMDLDGSYDYSMILDIVIDHRSELLITPNPAIGRVVVQLPQIRQDGHLLVLDMQGKVQANQPITAGQGTAAIDASQFATGMYIVRLQVPGLTLNRKLVLDR
ncbi:MAG: PQQ-dependent sugar dehydrogenase [Saprospiraceae bacterium]|nr:PQQ-dependent sugar dehydrogenase [Saprospiraceae bacterium]